MRRQLAASVAAFALLHAACAEPAAAEQVLTVFAAASLAGPFAELAVAFEREQPSACVRTSFAGTSRLVLQLREGAEADVFASADELQMQRVELMGLVGDEPRVFARNRLAIVTAPGNPHDIGALADLARDGLRVALCGPSVPAGRYARRALAAAGVVVRPVSDEPNVRALVAKVELGEVDAGVVYSTDVLAARGRVAGVVVAAQHQVDARYPIAALGRSGTASALGKRFVRFVQSPAGRTILSRYGFLVP